ncbi:hypothetical protein Bbelb_152220 [Branchiostoma belcheri]|nr:hypothetical protein Bbelb_152220 [Branchiostoma belcheri]
MAVSHFRRTAELSNKMKRLLVFLLIILKEAGSTTAHACSCSSQYGCNCSGRCLISSVPQDLPTYITELRLSSNDITTLSQSDFSRYRSLVKLDLRNNQISTINSGVFRNLTRLTYLHLNNNQLTVLRADMFVGLDSLQELHLHYNNISTIAAEAFVNLQKLERLDLSHNRIMTFPSDLLSNMNITLLSDLRLNDNQMETLPAMAYDILASIETVNISNNPWQCDCRMYPFKERMTGIPDFESQIQCAASVLEDKGHDVTETGAAESDDVERAHGPALDDLDLGYRLVGELSNEMERLLVLLLIILKEAVPTAACNCDYWWYGRFYICDCSSRGLSSVPQNLRTSTICLYLSSNDITTLSQSDFSRYSRLVTLDLYNNQISTINSGAFCNLTRLTILRLNNNQLTILRADMFVGLDSLQQLYLYYNNISTIGAEAFVNLPRLEYLSLHDNQITSLPSDVFAELDSLDTLFLHYNNIPSIEAGTFHGMPRLRNLTLYNNNISTIASEAFLNLPSLKQLSLHFNQLTNLQSDMFVGLDSLLVLYLHHNNISTTAAGTFVNLHKLETLDLSHNNISTIAAEAFVNLQKLEKLYLSHNRISTFPSDLLSNLNIALLSNLSLNDNQMETLSYMAYNILASFKTVDISNNPWQCDCRMYPFKQRMTGILDFESQIQCAASVLEDKSLLHDVTPEDLICEGPLGAFFLSGSLGVVVGIFVTVIFSHVIWPRCRDVTETGAAESDDVESAHGPALYDLDLGYKREEKHHDCHQRIPREYLDSMSLCLGSRRKKHLCYLLLIEGQPKRHLLSGFWIRHDVNCNKIQTADPDLSGADDDLDDPLWWEKRRIFFDVFRLFATLLAAMHFFPIPSINLNITATIAIIPLVTLDVVTHCYFFSGIVRGGSAKSAALHLAPDLLHLYGICCTAVILTFYYDQHLESAPGIDQYMKPFWPLLLADLLGITGVLLILCRNRYRCSLAIAWSRAQVSATCQKYLPLHLPRHHLKDKRWDPVCDYQSACERFQKSLGIDGNYFSHEQDKCFCETCHKARGDKDTYSRGEPEKTYAMPVGWTRFGLSLNPTFKDSELNVFDNWHRAYHGTHPDAVKKILQNSSQLLMPGDVALGGRKLGEREGHFNPTSKPEGFDTAQVFVTPSIVYAGLDAYASPQRFEDDGKVYKARVAFQLCIRPDSYTIGPETVGARRRGETIDPLFSNDELEWSTKERGGTALYGLLVKLEPFVDDSEGDVALGGRKLGEREGHFNPTSKPEGFDTAQVFVTPSIVYAGLDAYASPQRFEDDGEVYKARVAFQLCIRPDSYRVGPETVGARRRGETIDPLFSNDELEWSTKERGGTALYGLLVKLEPFVDSDGVDIDESTFTEKAIDNKQGGFTEKAIDNKQGRFTEKAIDNKQGGFTEKAIDKQGGFTEKAIDNKQGRFTEKAIDNKQSPNEKAIQKGKRVS